MIVPLPSHTQMTYLPVWRVLMAERSTHLEIDGKSMNRHQVVNASIDEEEGMK